MSQQNLVSTLNVQAESLYYHHQPLQDPQAHEPQEALTFVLKEPHPPGTGDVVALGASHGAEPLGAAELDGGGHLAAVLALQHVGLRRVGTADCQAWK